MKREEVDRKKLSPGMLQYMEIKDNYIVADRIPVRYKADNIMIESEKVDYDIMFPQHPLSEIRALIKYIVENN